MDTQLRRASGAELDLFYEWMRKQFHPGELKRLSHLHEMCARGLYAAYGLWSGDNLIAYALLGNTPDGRYLLLDYYAVLPEHQDQGWGGRFLARLCETRSLQGRGLEIIIAKSAATARTQNSLFARLDQFEQHFAGFCIFHYGTHRNGEGDVRTVFSVTKRSAAALAVFRYDVPAEFEVNEGPVLRVGLQDNAPASSSVAPVRAALRNVFGSV